MSTIKEAGWNKGDRFDWFGVLYEVTRVERRWLFAMQVVLDTFGRECRWGGRSFHLFDLKHAKKTGG